MHTPTITMSDVTLSEVGDKDVTVDLGELGRLEEPSLLVLISLSNGSKHGYAIQTDVREFSGSSLGPGTLYSILPRLERLGLIDALPAENRRRPYRITAEGAVVLREQLTRLRGVTEAGLGRLEVSG
jgi:DNA-binding PadR family transcriptional regulator